MWINVNTREVFSAHGAIRAAFPNVSFPSPISDGDLLAVDLHPLRVTEKPEFNPIAQDLVAMEPEFLEEGGWLQQWQVVEKYSAEEKARVLAEAEAQKLEEQKASVRAARNAKLTASDWTQVADAPVDKAAWATYRQSLRDVTSQAGFPYDVQWPEEPFEKSSN